MCIVIAYSYFYSKEDYSVERGKLDLDFNLLLFPQSKRFYQMFLFLENLQQLCFTSFPLIYIKEKERWICLSHGKFLLLQILARTCSQKNLILSSITSLLVAIYSSQIRIPYGAQAEVYLEPSQTFTMELSFENNEQLRAINYYCKKAPSQMFNWVLNMTLVLNIKNFQSFIIAEFFIHEL